MNRNVVTIESSEPVYKAIEKMVEHDIGNVLVVEKGKPIGIFTERDIMKKCVFGGRILEARIRDFMSGRPLIEVTPQINALEALQVMRRNGIRRLPVIENGRLVGIVTEKDLVNWIIKAAYAPSPPPF